MEIYIGSEIEISRSSLGIALDNSIFVASARLSIEILKINDYFLYKFK